MIHNIKRSYAKQAMSVQQITRCEKVGVQFDFRKRTTEEEIQYLQRAINEGIHIEEYVEKEKYSIASYVTDLRRKYEKEELSKSQLQSCIDELKIIIPKEQLKTILNAKIRESALKNIVFGDGFSDIL